MWVACVVALKQMRHPISCSARKSSPAFDGANMSDASNLRELCERLAKELREEWPEFEGHSVRADAGDAGKIYVALREARHEREVGEEFAEKLEPWLVDRLAERAGAYDFAVSVGRSDRDLLLQVDVRPAE